MRYDIMVICYSNIIIMESRTQTMLVDSLEDYVAHFFFRETRVGRM